MRDTYIFIAFCVFMLLLGMRLKQRLSGRKKETQEKINKNQRPKVAASEEPQEVKDRRLRRERRTRYFTIAQLFVLLGLMVFMIPALVRDLTTPENSDAGNLILRCVIFAFTIYVFILGYLRAFGKKRKNNENENAE